MACSSMSRQTSLVLEKGEWMLSGSYRYYKSYKHFKGDSEQKERVEDGTQVINISHSIEPALSYGICDRSALNINLPFVYYDRSSLYEHYGNSIKSNPQQKRFHTQANGLGDLRISANYWIWNPKADSLNKNISFAFGIKLPTGNSNVKDDFHKPDIQKNDSVYQKPVDQSIQPGDGGFGFTVETSGYVNLSKKSLLYFNGFYLFNPRNINNTLSKGVLSSVPSVTDYHSVADQFAARFAYAYLLIRKYNFSINLGARIEGIPAIDLIGKSEGFRRPGYIISAEPGLTAGIKRIYLSLSIPYALYRNRTKSYADKQNDKSEPGVVHHGDAAFADYLVSLGITYKFGR
jgi:hypothetical protein